MIKAVAIRLLALPKRNNKYNLMKSFRINKRFIDAFLQLMRSNKKKERKQTTMTATENLFRMTPIMGYDMN